MTEWRKVKLGDICSIKSGKRLPKGADFSSCPTENKYIRARDIKNGVINGEDLAFISNEVKERISKYIVNTNDVIVTIAGTIGEVAFVTSQYDGVNLTENAIRLTDFDHEVNSKYVFYTLRSNDYYEHMQKIAGGAAQPKMGIYKVEAISIALPSVDTQERIVDILSRYDALIENYQRQIKLLEEAAQRLYKEWFVDLRFPGHQSTPIINGVPKGWEKKKLGDLIELQSGYAFKSSTFESDGKYKIVTIKNVKDGSFDGDNVSLIKVVPEKMPSHCSLLSGDILLSLTGNVGRVCMMIGDNFLLNQRVAKLKTNYPTFAYALFRSHDMFIAVNNLANGAAQQNVSPIRIAELPLTIPPKELLDSFERIAGRYRVSILKSQTQIRNLSEARDRLLPKLMSGEIEV